MNYKNTQLDAMVNSLKPLLGHKDKIGYVAARNTRIILDALTEYYSFRNELIEKYGEPVLDEDGNETGQVRLSLDSPKYRQYIEEFKDINNVEQSLDLMTLPYEEVIGELTGEEILLIDWMLEE